MNGCRGWRQAVRGKSVCHVTWEELAELSAIECSSGAVQLQGSSRFCCCGCCFAPGVEAWVLSVMGAWTDGKSRVKQEVMRQEEDN